MRRDNPRRVTDEVDPARERRPVALIVLAALLALEALALWLTAAWELVELLTQPAASAAGAIALLALVIVAAAWVSAIAVFVLRQRGWTRAAAVVWQVVQAAVGIGFLQGVDANIALGLALIIPSVVVVGLLFTPAVLAATGAEDAGSRTF